MFITLVCTICITTQVKASEATCVYPLYNWENSNYFTVKIKNGKISVEYNVKDRVTVNSTLTVNNFINSENQLECLNKISYSSGSDNSGMKFSISTSSGDKFMNLDTTKSVVKNDKPDENSNTTTEETLLKCSYSNNFLIKTNKQINVELANGYTVSSKPGYEQIGNVCPEEIYITCGTRGQNYCNVSLEANLSSTKYILDSKVQDADNLNNPSNSDNTQADKDKQNSNNVGRCESGYIEDEFWGCVKEEDFVTCGSASIPSGIADISRATVTIIKIAAPLVLIIMGMIDIAKAVAASDEKKIKESQGKFVKRLIPAAMIFLVVTIIQLLVGILADNQAENDSLTKCIDCMISDKNSCE